MTPSLRTRTRIEQAAALNFEPIPIVDLSPEEFSEREGIAAENARLAPLIRVLIDICEMQAKTLSSLRVQAIVNGAEGHALVAERIDTVLTATDEMLAKIGAGE